MEGAGVEAVVDMKGEKEIDKACVQTAAMTREGSCSQQIELTPLDQMGEYTQIEIVASTTEGLIENRLQTDVSPLPISISKDLDSNWVASMRRKLQVEPGRIKASSVRNTCSIHRVPKMLRQHDKEAYEPQLISMGPFHYDKRSTHLAAMEEHKWRYLNAILTRNGENDALEQCLIALEELEQEARECYSEEIRLDSNSFVEMMVLDGCFLIEFIRTGMDNAHEDDPLLKVGWIRYTLFLDLLLLENQIPFLILKPLLNLMNISFDSFNFMVLAVCTSKLLFLMNKKFNNTNVEDHLKYASLSISHQDQIHHLLHLFHSIVLPQTSNEKPEKGSTIEMIPCASRLREAGIKFKNRNAYSFLDIKFQNGLIEIPSLIIEDSTNGLFRNLIAFEQCYPHCNSYFATYRRFMDCIVQSAEDVEILNRNGIMDNWLGCDEDVAVIFNNMGKNVCLSADDFYLLQMFNEINKYYGTRWHRWRASLLRNYFNNPWVIISLIAAAIFLLLTATQTFFASFPTFAYGN